MNSISTVEGLNVDYDSLFEDMKQQDDLKSFLKDNFNQYCGPDDTGSEIISFEYNDDEYNVKYHNSSIDDWYETHDVYEIIHNNNVIFGDTYNTDFDPYNFTCSDIDSVICYDIDDIIKQYEEWVEEEE